LFYDVLVLVLINCALRDSVYTGNCITLYANNSKISLFLVEIKINKQKNCTTASESEG